VDLEDAMLTTNNLPRRRLRDRLVEREGTANPQLAERRELANQLLLVDDDMREAALAIGSIERFLADALALLDGDDVNARELLRLATDGDVLDRLDTLSETFQSLRRRLGTIAETMREPAGSQSALK
jgi:hypothetical protein